MTSPHDDAPRPPAWTSPSGTPPATGRTEAPPPSAPPSWGQQAAGWGPALPPPLPPQGGAWRPPALQPGIVPLRPLSLGEILDGAFRAIRANPRVMFGLSALVVTVAVALQSLTRWYTQGLLVDTFSSWSTDLDPTGELDLAEQMGASLGTLVGLPFTQVATTVLTGLLILSVSRSVLGRSVSVGEALRTSRVWWVLGFTALVGLAEVLVVAAVVGVTVLLLVQDHVGAGVVVALLGGLALLVTLVWLSVRTLLVPPALVLEGKGFWRTVSRAWRLTRGSFWRLLGTYVLVTVIISIVSNVVVVPITIVTAAVLQDPAGTSLASIVLTGVGNVVTLTLTTAYMASVVALLYVDVRMRREGLDVELARAAQGDG